jgi:hypothetical protein
LIKYKDAQNYVTELFKDQKATASVEIYSRSVQDEITFVYYLNLLKKYYSVDQSILREDAEGQDNPHEALSKILEQDNEIVQWFSSWMKDIRQYENETFEIIKNYEETKHFVFKQERIDEEEAQSWI